MADEDDPAMLDKRCKLPCLDQGSYRLKLFKTSLPNGIPLMPTRSALVRDRYPLPFRSPAFALHPWFKPERNLYLA